MKVKTILISSVLVVLLSAVGRAQTTAFNFQGRLNDGTSPANGRYDLQFKLFDAITGGNQIAVLDRTDLQLINGVFSTTLNFGAASFNGGNRFIEISVRPNGSPNAYVVLGARQQILSVPYSVRAVNATNADNATFAQDAVNAINSTNATIATTAQNSSSLGGVGSSEYLRRNIANSGDLQISGNLDIGGSAKQPAASLGFPKAMIYVSGIGGVISCYNGVSGLSSGTCGFSVQEASGLVGVYNIDFGFNIFNRFIVLTAEYGATQNKGANFKFINNTRVDVWTFFTDLRSDTARANFMIIVY